jgi:cysteinyl-tRNA synthetase
MSRLKLFDSYLKKIIEFDTQNNSLNQTVEIGKLKIYHCGMTVYSYAHIGNIYGALVADFIVKSASYLGFKVEYAENITDVGHLVADGDDGLNITDAIDKIELAAEKESKSVLEISEFYTKYYQEQCQKLGITLPTDELNPKASDYIKEQLEIAIELLNHGSAYYVEGDGIYFDYLKNIDLNVPFDKRYFGDKHYNNRDIKSNSKHPKDFAIWKFVNEKALQKWKIKDFVDLVDKINPKIKEKYPNLIEAFGCPGWHTECVSMIGSIFGKKNDGFFMERVKNNENYLIDIHLGGIEHIPVHHQNEIWQSEALNFHLAKYWVHNQHLVINGEKMSKSKGLAFYITNAPDNLKSIESEGYSYLAFRLMSLENHYQNTLDFTWDKLQQSQNRLYNIRKNITKILTLTQILPSQIDTNKEFDLVLSEKVGDNLQFFEVLNLIQSEILEILTKATKNEEFDYTRLNSIYKIEKTLLNLQLFISDFNSNLNYHEALKLVNARLEAKKEKNYSKSDEIRQEIEKLQFKIEDYSGDKFGLIYLG